MAVTTPTKTRRLRMVLRGAVQGVGFRPTVYRLAQTLRVGGWVRNSTAGLEIEVEGTNRQVNEFVRQVQQERPRAAVITAEEVLEIEPSGATRFEIHGSEEAGPKTVSVLPDLATCPACVRKRCWIPLTGGSVMPSRIARCAGHVTRSCWTFRMTAAIPL